MLFTQSLFGSILLSEAGSPGQSGAPKADFENFVLALEFQPTWSQGRECDAAVTQHLRAPQGGFARTHMSIHGMWPNYVPALHNGYQWPQFCEEYADCESGSGGPHCQLQRLPRLLFNSSLLRRWQTYAGEYAFGDLATHEYTKHGSCTGMSQWEYFREIEKLMVPLLKQSSFSEFVASHIGEDVEWESLRDAFQAATGGHRVALRCNAQCQLSEAWLAYNATMRKNFWGVKTVVPDMAAPMDASDGDTDTCEQCGRVHLIDFDKEGCTTSTTTSAPSSDFDLPFGDINVMVVTDTHSWIAGHKHEPRYDITYGDVLSFHQRLKEDCDRNGRDLFFVMNGDINDGTGLSTDPPVELVPLLQKMPWDAVTVGNHELYKNEFINYLSRPGGFVEFWGDRYLTANVVNATTKQPWGRTHKFLHGEHGTTVLALGFLYNMTDHDSAVDVLHAEDVVAQPWFQSLLRGDEGAFDAVLILGHMHYVHPYVTVILTAIRALQPDVPVQFVTGHSHHRLYEELDNFSSSFEAGNYLNTIGFASFPTMANAQKNTSQAKARGFSHVFIDANVARLNKIAGMADITTSEGAALTTAIRETREKMGLSKSLGCAPQTFEMYSPLNESNSLWGVILNNLIVETLWKSNSSYRVYIQSTASIRYDLYAGNVTKDDIVTMSPFADDFWLISERISGRALAATMSKLNENSKYALPPFVSTGFEENASYEVYGGTYDVGTVERPGHLLSQLQLEVEERLAPAQRFIGKTTTNLWYDFVPKGWPCDTTLLV